LGEKVDDHFELPVGDIIWRCEQDVVAASAVDRSTTRINEQAAVKGIPFCTLMNSKRRIERRLCLAVGDKFHRQLPGADLLQSNVYDGLMEDVTDIKDLGSGVINGQECDHLAFRAKDTDWQIWIHQGANPYPCRYVITSKGVDQAPQFTLEVRDWKVGGSPGAADFTFKAPAGAKKLDAKDIESLKDTSDLPDNYKIGATQ